MVKMQKPQVDVITEPSVVEVEKRFTFTTQFTEVSRVQTRLEEVAFKLNLPIVIDKIGGITNQTYGVKVKAYSNNASNIDEFEKWFDENISDLVQPRNLFGVGIKKYL